MYHIAKCLFWASLCLTFSSCATARLANQGNIKAPIEMKTYRININDKNAWNAWEASTKPENDTLVLKRLRTWPLTGEVQGFTTITVIRDSIASEGWSLSETAHADNVRAIEENIMREKGSAEGNYEIQELSKGDFMRNGKKLYSITWTASQRREGLGSGKHTVFMKGAMYLLFPEGYKDTHAFYRFLITDAVIPPTFLNVNVEQIYPLIDDFVLK